MIMNVLSGVWSNVYILQIIIQEEFARELDFKDIKFPVQIRDIYKVEKKNCITISVFGYEHKEKYPIYVSKQML